MKLKRNLVAGVVAALAVAGGGAAFAATQLGSPKEESQAIVNDAAKQLGVPPDKLSSALKQAYKNRVDAAVKAGELTEEQGKEMKARIDSEDFPLLGVHGPGFGHHGHGPFGVGLDAAATYLGLTETELHTQLESGKTLADIAKAKGKSVDGLIDALYASAKKRLDEAVTAGKLTQAQADRMLADLKQHLTDLVNGKLPPRPDRDGPHGDGFRAGDRFGGPGPGFAPSSDAPPAFAAPTA